MAKQQMILLKEVEITNNCPECFNQELKLSFYQKHTEGIFVKKVTNQVVHEIKCKTCFSLIYPVNWTPDIERVFDYYNKLVVPKKASTRFKPLLFVVILLAVAAVGGVLYALMSGII